MASKKWIVKTNKKTGKSSRTVRDSSQMSGRQQYNLEKKRLKGSRSKDYYEHREKVAEIRGKTTRSAGRTTGATTVGASSMNQMDGKEEVNDTLLTGGVGSTHNTNIYISDSKKAETDDDTVNVIRKTRTD